MLKKDIESVKLTHPDAGMKSCSWDGQQWDREKDGTFTVPAEAFQDLRWHGFVPAPAR